MSVKLSREEKRALKAEAKAKKRALKAEAKANKVRITPGAIAKNLKKHYALYLMALPMMVFVIIFSYLPMPWILMAFQNFKPALGLFGSQWVGLENFQEFFGSPYFGRLIRNTLSINLMNLVISYPLTIILSLLINDINNKFFKKSVQVISYMPNFVSTVIVCGLVLTFCGPDGIISNIYNFLTGSSGSMMTKKELFQPIYVFSGIWQSLGFSTVLYVAALSNVDQGLYEAASLDGANRLQQAWHVTLPSILPTIALTLIMSVGGLLGGNSEKIILLYNSATMDTADTIASYVYRKGLVEARYGFSTAVGLFNSVINLALIVGANKVSKKLTETSLF